MTTQQTWYRVKKYENEIGKFPVERFTESTIWWTTQDGRKMQSKRHSSYDDFFPTKIEAVEFLRARISSSLEYHMEQVAEGKAALAKLI